MRCWIYIFLVNVRGAGFMFYQKPFCNFRQMGDKSKVAFSKCVDSCLTSMLSLWRRKEVLPSLSCGIQVGLPRPCSEQNDPEKSLPRIRNLSVVSVWTKWLLCFLLPIGCIPYLHIETQRRWMKPSWEYEGSFHRNENLVTNNHTVSRFFFCK